MATPKQIQANQQNAQLSTGPLSDTGRQTSAQNATKHGYTGKTLILTEEEKPAYEAHVKSYYADYSPIGARQAQLLQQLADHHWSLHQIFIEQSNFMSLISVVNNPSRSVADPLETAKAVAGMVRTLNTLSLYEARRRRAAKSVEEELLTLQQEDSDRLGADLAKAAVLYKSHKAQGKAFDPAAFGFVCSLAEVLDYLKGQEAAADVKKYQLDPATREICEKIAAESVEVEDERERILAEMSALCDTFVP